MNSHRSFIALVSAMAVLMMSSCSKEEGNRVGEVREQGAPTVFKCRFEVPVDASVASKVDIAEGEGQQRIPVWEEGDKIRIFYKDPATGEMASTEGTANATGTETTFTASLPEGVSTYFAVYPSSLDSSVDEQGNFSVKTRKGGEDETIFSQACICIAKSGAEKQFQFRNLCAILKFTLENKGSILQICSLGLTPVDGTIAASIGENGEIVYAQEPYSDTHYSRQFKKVAADNTTCYIPILPGAMEKGIAINHLATYTAPAAFANVSIPFERSCIYDLGVVDSHVVKDYYFTENGRGDKSGLSWENAGNSETLKKLLGRTDPAGELNGTRYLHIWKTKGITCHFGAGTYVLGDDTDERLTVDFSGADGTVYSEFSFRGGYPSNGGESADPEHNKTVFSGNDAYGILNVYDRARIHIDGITFAHASSANVGTSDNTIARGAALYLKDGYGSSAGNQEKERKAAPRVWLTNCIFEDNRTLDATAAAGNYMGGSAINIANGAVYADHCIFRNNYDKGFAGCIRLSGNYDREWLASYAFFNACLFTGNTVGTYRNDYGCVIQQNRKGALLGMYNCTLYNNNAAAPDSERYGWNIMNFERSAIIANTTIIDNIYSVSNTSPGYAIRVNGKPNGMNHYIFANNLLMNTQAPASLNRGYTSILPDASGTSTARFYMEGGSLFGFWQSGYGNTSYVFKNGTEYGSGSSSSAYAYSDIDNPSFSDGLFRWAGTLKEGTVTCNFMSSDWMKSNVLKSANINQEDSASHVTFTTTETGSESNYPGFFAWLNSLNAIDVDAEGTPRPASGWTPGAYQVQ
ncbi:MAG: hypothetical protein IJQ61_06890 [Bacteroidales bacterium]|nr:hypothetical protein [Bacteroidales bacterium]